MISLIRFNFIAIFTALFLFVGLSSSPAEKITDISIQYMGAESVDQSAIMAQIRTKAGSELDPQIVEEDIKNLYSSGLVESVRVLTEPKGDGLKVIYLVQTRSTLGEISFIGNSISSNKLRKDTELEIGDSFDDSSLEKARVSLEDTYKRKGYSNVGITYKVDGAQRPGFSRVTFVIDEGTLERLKKVKFYGNESFSDKVLSGQMMVKASRSFNPFKKNRGIDSAELEEDIIRIEEFYRDNGYLNARVSDVEREPDGEKVNLILQVAEGKKFTINKVSVSGIKAISVSDVLPLL